MGMWGIGDSLFNAFNKYIMVVVYFTLWAKRAAGTSISYSLTVSDFQFKKGNFGNEFVTFAKQIKKARQSGLH